MAINLSLKQIKAKIKWNVRRIYTNRFLRFYFSYFRGKEVAEVNALLENSSNFGTIYIMVFNGLENYWNT